MDAFVLFRKVSVCMDAILLSLGTLHVLFIIPLSQRCIGHNPMVNIDQSKCIAGTQCLVQRVIQIGSTNKQLFWGKHPSFQLWQLSCSDYYISPTRETSGQEVHGASNFDLWPNTWHFIWIFTLSRSLSGVFNGLVKSFTLALGSSVVFLCSSSQIAKHSLMKQDCVLKVRSWEEMSQLPHPPKTLHYK